MICSRTSLITIVCVLTVWSPLFITKQFVSWDDHENYKNNPHLNNGILNIDNLKHLATPLLGVFEPVANLIKLIVITVSNTNVKTDSATPFLLCNLLIHILNTILIQKLIHVRSGKNTIQWTRVVIIIPVMFAIHPLRVEAVAWASCLPYQVATFFSLIGTICHEKNSHRIKALAFFCAVLSKSSSITVPVSLFVMDMWGTTADYSFKHVYASIRRNLTAIFMTACGVITAIWSNQESPKHHNLGIAPKIIRACYAWCFYLIKSIVPSNLNVIYMLPNGAIDGLNVLNWYDNWLPLSQPVLLVTILLLTCIFILLKKEVVPKGRFDTVDCDTRSMSRRWSMFVVSYTIVLLPCLGFIQHGYLTMAADRYSYLVSAVVIVPFLTIEFDRLCIHFSTNLILRRKLGTLSKSKQWHNRILTVAGFACISIFSKITRDQLGHWRSSIHLWKHASSLYPTSIELMGNLAEAYSQKGGIKLHKRSIALYEKAIRMSGKTASAQLHHMYAEALTNSNDIKLLALAKENYEKAISIDSMLSESMGSLAWWHEKNNEFDGGMVVYNYYKQAEETAMFATTKEGRLKKQRLKSKTMPNNILKSTAFYLGYGLAIDRIIKRQKQGLGDYALDIVLESSKEKYLKAISIDATAREAYYRLGKLETSIKIAHDWYDKALLHSPNGDHFVDVNFAKGNLYQRSGKDLQAIGSYLQAIKYEPNATDLRINCAISYRNAGELEKAKEMAQSILKLDSFHKKANWLIDVLNNPNI